MIVFRDQDSVQNDGKHMSLATVKSTTLTVINCHEIAINRVRRKVSKRMAKTKEFDIPYM